MTQSPYEIRRIHYETYAEVLTLGDKKSELVTRGLTYEQAMKAIAELGTCYAAFPQGEKT